MFNLKLVVFLICCEVTITVYQPVESQTDNTPLITADGSKINKDNPQKWIAVSRDLLKEFPYGTKVQVSGSSYDGIYTVHDTMNKRYKKRIDILISLKQKIGKWKGTIKKVDSI